LQVQIKKAVLGVTVDITEQKKLEAERAKMTDDIIKRNKDLEQFSYMVSHNLRAPIANIRGLTEIMQFPDLDDGDEKRCIAELDASVKQLDTVIVDLNYILQVTHRENEMKEQVKFSVLLKDVELSILNLIKNDSVQIIPDFSAIDQLYTLKSYLYSIFFNLISNSIKYRQPEIKPVITITSAKLNNKVQIIFKDNGLGIDLERNGGEIYGLYKRFHNHVEGKGVGLYMVKTQVESLQGKITVSSEVNKGTEFIIEFEIN